jgi:hypothetical protein
MNTDWLADLAPEHAPAAPGWWPPAPGWWALGVMLLALTAAAILWWRNPRRRLQRATLRELRLVRAQADDAAHTAQAVQSLLRRYALARFGRDNVARLSGAHWLAFLAERGGDAFGGSVGDSLLAAAYGGRSAEVLEDDRDRWINAAERFVRRARMRRGRGRPS